MQQLLHTIWKCSNLITKLWQPIHTAPIAFGCEGDFVKKIIDGKKFEKRKGKKVFRYKYFL